MKNILFVTDSFVGGGLETRIIDQIKALRKNKVKPYLLSREINPSYKKHFVDSSDALSLYVSGSTLSAQSILKDADIICQFCIDHNIDFIDCHPFWCILPVAIASAKLNISNSFTLHGVTSGNFIPNKYSMAQPIYNLVLSYGFSQTFAVAEYLTDLYPQLTHTKIIRNGFNIHELKQKPFKNTHKVAVASRLDEQKAQIVMNFLPELYSCESIKQIDIFGAGNHSKAVQKFITDNHYENKIHLKGWVDDLSETIYRDGYMLVFGMGRVVLDALKSSSPVGVLGYGGFAGLVNRTNLAEFSKDNLTSWQKTDATLSEELNMLFKNPNPFLFTAKNLSIFNREIIWKTYYDIATKLQPINHHYIEKIYNILTQNPSANILNDDPIFLECIRMLSDGNKPISPKLFYNIFQYQLDEINKFQQHERSYLEQIKQLEQMSQKPLNRIINRLASGPHKNKKN